ncbi:hypothetical protein [Sphaerisporangium perillae]|uniref:hypothetical protein n=1 Tax=Sphaerisporangium perillae TaxID=2935860 RepID=UPI00200FD32F|nr:hypothetical protein [Sphaerisporangium perillae]
MAFLDRMTGSGSATSRRPRMLARFAPAFGLFFLTPLVAEYLLGNIPPAEIAGVLILAPMYGGGALIIREVARRTGRGWPTIMLLAAAYGLLEAGLLDQSLFNPSFDEGYDFQSVAHVPVLGVSAFYAETFIAGHAIWSIGVPIVIVESLVPGRRTTPWLGRVGLTMTCVIFLLGSAAIFADHVSSFLAPVPRLLGAGALIVALIGSAFALGRRRGPDYGRPGPENGRSGREDGRSGPEEGRSGLEDGRSGLEGRGRAPNPWVVGTVAFVASSVFVVRPESWWGAGIGIVLLAVMAVLVVRWSRRTGWAAVHRFALGGGALLTYAWAGFVLLALEGNADAANLVGQLVLVLGAVALLFAAGRVASSRRGRA